MAALLQQPFRGNRCSFLRPQVPYAQFVRQNARIARLSNDDHDRPRSDDVVVRRASCVVRRASCVAIGVAAPWVGDIQRTLERRTESTLPSAPIGQNTRWP
jgi:hypothetical protein